MSIFVQAMHYPASAAMDRAVGAREQAGEDGFLCRAATAEDGTLVGFAFGNTTRSGQSWHDVVRSALDDHAARDWLHDAFELSEVHVLPSWQGRGIGRQLIAALAADTTPRTMLLSTPDADTRARRMYRRLGFIELVRGELFPGDQQPFVVLGARLPLAAMR